MCNLLGGFDSYVDSLIRTNYTLIFSKLLVNSPSELYRSLNISVMCISYSKQIKTMQAMQKPGVIINMGSASGLYPMVIDPIYSGSKGMFFLIAFSLIFSLKTFLWSVYLLLLSGVTYNVKLT